MLPLILTACQPVPLAPVDADADRLGRAAPTPWVGLYPRGGGSDLTGGGQLAVFEADLGRAVPVVQTYRSTSAAGVANTRPDLEAIFGHGAVAHLNVEPSGYTATQYAAGTADPKVAADFAAMAGAIADALADHPGSRVILTFGAEMNGDWTDWGCLPVADWVDLWRGFHGLVRSALAARGLDARRVRFAFGPNNTSSAGCAPGDDYYPGAAYVDLVGQSSYRSGTSSVGATVLDHAHALLDGIGWPDLWRQDRFVLLQTGTRDIASDDSDVWAEALVAAVAADPVFSGLIWFNDGDWRIWDGAPRDGYHGFVEATSALPATPAGLPAVFEPYFWDVPVDAPHFDAIQALKANGVTSGCRAVPPLYCPDGTVTRRDAATLLGKAFGLAPDTAGPQRFTDVPPSDPAYGWVQALAKAGATNGCSATTYCPDATLTATQLRAFLAALADEEVPALTLSPEPTRAELATALVLAAELPPAPLP